MAQIQKVESEMEVKGCAEKLYGLFTKNTSELAKSVPEVYNSINVIEGDGNSLGTVRIWNYKLGDNSLALKERTNFMDKINRSITYSFLEGEVMNDYEMMDFKYTFTPKGEGMTLVKCSIEFVKANQDVPTPTAYVDIGLKVVSLMAAHLLKQQP